MTTSFSSLPIIDLTALSAQSPACSDLKDLSTQLYDVFSSTGFAYLTSAPLSFSHEDVFDIARDFFKIDEEQKAKLTKKTFVPSNKNTYRGYFPTQPGQQDNLKEGFEVGPPVDVPSNSATRGQKFDLAEPNVWPEEHSFENGKARLEKLYTEIQSLSARLLSLLAISLGKPADFFSSYLTNSLSTLTVDCCTTHHNPSLETSKAVK